MSSDNVSMFLGNGDGTFQPAVNYGVGAMAAIFIVIGDLNGDERLDLAVTCASFPLGRVAVLLGNGDGKPS